MCFDLVDNEAPAGCGGERPPQALPQVAVGQESEERADAHTRHSRNAPSLNNDRGAVAPNCRRA
eukprot:14412015-Alexandrium_andersonii.AAC.1